MKDILSVLGGKKTSKTPIWIMRQAGRYLPEYREVRAQTNNFLEFCYNPELASKVTLQPLERFNLSAAIIFSDILVILDALGNEVSFKAGEGPKIVFKDKMLKKDFNGQEFSEFLNPVYDAIKLTKKDLKVPLIGFSGAVWTLFAYLINGGSSKDYGLAKAYAIEKREETKKIIDLLKRSIVLHLKNQIRSGCDIVKIFDSWAGVLPEELIDLLVINPTAEIVEEIKAEFPQTKIITFPRGMSFMQEKFLQNVKTDCVALDYSFPISRAKNIYDKFGVAIQGNLDPAYLLINDLGLLESQIKNILNNCRDIPHIFNLGHGVTPESKIENVKFLVNYLQEMA